MAISPPIKAQAVSQEELRRGAATDALRSRFTRQLEELPAAVARGASQAAAMGMRGRGRSMAGSAQSRQAMADAAMQGAQAKAEVTSQIQEAQKQTAGKKKALLAEIEELRKAKRYNKDAVGELRAIYGDDQEMLDFIDAKVEKAPTKSVSQEEGSRTLGGDIKQGLKYLGF